MTVSECFQVNKTENENTHTHTNETCSKNPNKQCLFNIKANIVNKIITLAMANGWYLRETIVVI